MADRIITCKLCGCAINLDAYKPNKTFSRKIKDEQICFECAYWNDIISHPKPDLAVINGSLYRIEGLTDYLNGFQLRQAEWRWKFLHDIRTFQIMACTRCKFIGKVPARFKDALPDHYRFISKETYVRIFKYQGTECRCRGCWDRYHCYWYNRAKAEKNGAWNKVPDNYKPGSEQCESFINKYTMYDINY